MRRKLVTNLTPLLDLVLLVIFAYQLQAAAVVRRAAETARAETEIRRDVEDSARGLLKKNQEMAEELRELREKNRTLEENVRRVSESLHALFGSIPEDRFYSALTNATREEIRRVQEQLDRPGEDVLRRLARVEAYNRHITSWMIHLRDDHVLEIRVNDGPAATVPLSDNEAELRRRISKALSDLEEPKDLVIVFYAWGRLLKERKDLVDDVLQHLTQETLRMRYASKRFYLSREGYRP